MSHGFTAVAAVLAVLLIGCGDGPVAGTDAGAPVEDAAVGTDAGSAFDPASVQWIRAAEPAAGPLMVWAFIAAPIDAHRTVVFGGTNANAVSGVTLGGTWLYDVSSGSLEVTEIASDGPAPRYCGCAGWDPVRERVVLTGGRDLSAPLSVPPETWELDLESGTWAEVAVSESPPGVIGCMMAWSPARGAMYLFGGAGGAGPSDVTYRFDPAGPSWIALDAPGPSARYDGILTELSDDELLLFGGSYGASGAAFFSDVWSFDTGSETWTELAVDGEVPEGRRVPWHALTPDRSGLFVSMGFDGVMEPIGDFWFLDLSTATWTQLSLPTELTARSFTHHLPAGGSSLGTMLGGYDGDGPVREVWELTVP